MKKLFCVLMGVALSVCLVGCGNQRGSVNSVREELEEVPDTEEIQEPEEVPEEVELDDSIEGYHEGRFGDTMETYFFDYTINSAYLCEEFNGYEPTDGKCLLVADATVKNTFNESLEMYDTDFQIQWNSDGDDDYDYPITIYADPVSDEQLLPEYELGINEEITGLLVFEVPEGENDFSISYLEMFDDDSEGDVYFVYFTARME